MENLLNLRGPLITPLIGFRAESGGRRELKTGRLQVKAKAVGGIAHGFGLLHGAVKAMNLPFDADR
jgi:hypothetical protein